MQEGHVCPISVIDTFAGKLLPATQFQACHGSLSPAQLPKACLHWLCNARLIDWLTQPALQGPYLITSPMNAVAV